MAVPIAQSDRVAQRSIAYAQALANEAIVSHVAYNSGVSAELRRDWHASNAQHAATEVGAGAGAADSGRARNLPQTSPRLVVIDSPYRSLTGPLIAYVDALRDSHPEAVITVVLPEFVPAHWWERALHNQTALRLKLAFYTHPNVVVANVPYHLR